MAERNTEIIRTEIADERTSLEGDLVTLRGDVRAFAQRAAFVSVGTVAALFVVRRAVRALLRRS